MTGGTDPWERGGRPCAPRRSQTAGTVDTAVDPPSAPAAEPRCATSQSEAPKDPFFELPELVKWSGNLPLKALVNIVGIAELADGGILAAVVLLP